MDKYTKVDQIIANAPPDFLRECNARGGCACMGCFSSLGITKSDYEKWDKRQKLANKDNPPTK